MKKVFFVQRAIAILIFVFAFIVGLSFAVMAIWNGVLVGVLHVSTINFWQALGIFGLAKILFGGFPGGGKFGGRGPRRWRENMEGGMREKWMNMSPDQREKFKQDWKSRCSGWKRPAASQASPASTNAAE